MIEQQVVAGLDPADALGTALDYSHEYYWDTEVAYAVQEVTE